MDEFLNDPYLQGRNTSLTQLKKKNSKFSFKPPKGKKLNILQELKRRIFLATEKLIISFLSNHPTTTKPYQKHERTP